MLSFFTGLGRYPVSGTQPEPLCPGPGPKRYHYDYQIHIEPPSEWHLVRSCWHCIPLPQLLHLFLKYHLMSARLRRINKEIARASEVQVSSFAVPVWLVYVLLMVQGCINDYKTDNIGVKVMDDSPFHVRGFFQGPQDSPYEGGTFELVSSTIFFLPGHRSIPRRLVADSLHRCRTSSSQKVIPSYRPK